MKLMTSWLRRAALASLAWALATGAVWAYPERPVRIVVPFAAGGFTDVMARLMAKQLGERLGQPFVVENKPGAGGNIGADAVARSAPDGYSLLISTITTHAINPTLYAKMPFDAVKDFAPVILLVATPNVLVVNRSEVKTVEQLRALAASRPQGLSFASSGVGTSSHLVAELFRQSTAIRMTHIPFKGSSQALTDLMAQNVDLMFDNLMFQAPHIKAGKVFAIGVTSTARSPLLPDVPTMAELGVRGMDYGAWFGVSAPAGTPPGIVNKLNAEMQQVLATAEFRKAMVGAELLGGTPEAFGRFIRDDIARWKTIIEQGRIEKQP